MKLFWVSLLCKISVSLLCNKRKKNWSAWKYEVLGETTFLYRWILCNTILHVSNTLFEIRFSTSGLQFYLSFPVQNLHANSFEILLSYIKEDIAVNFQTFVSRKKNFHSTMRTSFVIFFAAFLFQAAVVHSTYYCSFSTCDRKKF